MNEEHSAIRFVPFIAVALLATIITAFMIHLCRPHDNGGLSNLLGGATTTAADATTTTTATPTTTRIETVTNADGEVVTQIITAPTTTVSRSATTASTARITNPQELTYDTGFDFQGWQIEFKDGVYDAEARTVSFTVTELTTRDHARPINYYMAINEAAVEYTTAALPEPKLDDIYYEFEGLVNQATKITISNVDDFKYIKINLQTYSVAEDATDGTGMIVNDTRYIAAYQLTTL